MTLFGEAQKCQEWRAVYVLSAVDGCIPSDMATRSTSEIEEERRLLYVAMTRAKDHLNVVAPHRFYASRKAVATGTFMPHDPGLFRMHLLFTPTELGNFVSATIGCERPSAVDEALASPANATRSTQ